MGKVSPIQALLRRFPADDGRPHHAWAMLFLRVVIGFNFAIDGWGKLQHLDKVGDFFRELGIPAPHAQALFVSVVELVGGLAVALGILARLAALPLAATMLVAILTAKLPHLGEDAVAAGQTPSFKEKLFSFFTMDELAFLAIFVVLAAYGPGRISLDRILRRKLERA